MSLRSIKRRRANLHGVKLPISDRTIAVELDAMKLGHTPQHALKRADVNVLTAAQRPLVSRLMDRKVGGDVLLRALADVGDIHLQRPAGGLDKPPAG